MNKILLIISIVCASINSYAQSNIIKEDFHSKLAEYSKKNKTIECKFTHTKHIQKLTKEVVMQGDFYYDNGGSMALRYTNPKGDMIIIRNGNFSIVTAGKATTAQGNSNPMLEQIAQMMRACMTGDISQLGKGWETNYSYNNNKYEVELIPQDKRTKKYITNITLVFNGKNLTLESMRMQERLGNYSLYAFTDKTFNKVIDVANFELN